MKRYADRTPALARANPAKTDLTVGERVGFRVRDQSGDDWLTNLDWDLGDGSTGSGWWNAHRYDSLGTYTVKLTATDNTGHSTTDSVEITIES